MKASTMCQLSSRSENEESQRDLGLSGYPRYKHGTERFRKLKRINRKFDKLQQLNMLYKKSYNNYINKFEDGLMIELSNRNLRHKFPLQEFIELE